MIKFVATRPDGSKLLTLGLSRRNVQLLTAGRPIKVMGKEVGCDHNIYIFFGETEVDMLKALLRAGVKLPDTVSPHHDDERQEGGEH